MAIITEDYVSFETAKLLKEKGFTIFGKSTSNDIWCEIYYTSFGKFCRGHIDNKSKDIPAITQQMAMRWLRDVHNLFIGVGFGTDDKGEFLYMADIYNLKNDAIDGKYKPIVEADDYLVNNPKSYEEAVESAIKYCLENLI